MARKRRPTGNGTMGSGQDQAKLAGVEQAVVELSPRGGRGVLVAGGFVLTAAHCVRAVYTGDMALGDDYHECVKLADGQKLKLRVEAVEPVADIAALGAPGPESLADRQRFD